jgi:predicted ribosomally synthesized peptide with SipW-like signal peptide
MHKIFASTLTIASAGLLVVGGTGAFFSDTETASGNTFSAGVIDLMVDNESYYNGNKCTDIDPTPTENWQWQGSAPYPVPGTVCTTSWNSDSVLAGHLFFNFLDVKPDDEGEDTISLHVESNDAWACMNIALTSDDDVSSNEPELGAGDATNTPDLWDGELADTLEFVWWADDGDNVLETGETLLSQGVQSLTNLASTTGPFSVALADSVHNVWTGTPGPIIGGTTAYIGKAWCLGDLALTPLPTGTGVNPSVSSGVTCNGTAVGNTLQTDSATLDVSFFTMQARHDSEYRCPEPEQPPVACQITQTYADDVVASDQGLRKNLSNVTADRSNPAFALGAPQSLGTPYDNPVAPNSFFALGFPTATRTASVVLSFNDNYVVNGPGNDLKLWEVTGGTSYPDERVDVYVGDLSVGPWTLVGDNVTRDAEIDLGAVTQARFVRIVDASNLGLFEDTADGYDLDAVQALNCIVSPID